MSAHPGAPQQDRSRKTLEKLLAAATRLLELHGLEGTTIPRLAAEAGVSVGSVYRRFADKDALFRAAFLDLLETTGRANEQNLRPEAFTGRSLESLCGLLVRGMILQFRRHPGLLAALETFLDRSPDAEFREKALGMIAENYERIAGLLLPFSDQIAHAEARQAALFAVLSAVTVIQARTLGADRMWEKVAPLGDRELEREVTRQMVAYLTSPLAKA